MKRHDRLQKHRIRLHKSLFEGHDSSCLERHLRGVHRMIGAVIQDCLYSHNRISSQRTGFHGLSQSLFYRREVVLRNRSSDHLFFKDIRLIQIAGRLKTHFYMTVLAVPAGLLLVLGIHIGFFAYGLPESDLRLRKLHLHLIAVQQFGHYDINMHVTNSVNQRLMICRVINHTHGQILGSQSGKSLCHLIHIRFLHNLVSLGCIGLGECNRAILYRVSFRCQRISCSCACKLCDSTDISRMELRNLCHLISAHNIELSDLLLHILCDIIESIIALDNAGAYFDQRIFTQERICDCFENCGRFRFLEIIIRIKGIIVCPVQSGAFASGGIREITDDIVQQNLYALQVDRRTHADRNDASILHIICQNSADLRNGEFLSRKIAIHEVFAGFRDRFQKHLPVFGKIGLLVIRNRALFFFIFIDITASLVFHNIDVAVELSIFTKRHVQRGNSLAVHFLQLLHDLTVADIINVHVRYKKDTRETVALAEIPCLLRSYLHACLAGNHNNRSICRRGCFLCLSDKIKETGRIQNINFVFPPLNGNH